jgi:hypothetical protein
MYYFFFKICNLRHNFSDFSVFQKKIVSFLFLVQIHDIVKFSVGDPDLSWIRMFLGLPDRDTDPDPSHFF